MNKFILTPLLVGACSLTLGVARADDAPAAPRDTQSVVFVTAPSLPEKTRSTHLAAAGLGSLYWAARHPAQAWRVVLPVQPGTVAYAEIRAR